MDRRQTNLAALVQALDPQRVAELDAAIREADIARLTGNKKWYEVYAKKRDNASGKLKKLYAALYNLRSVKIQDAVFKEVK